MSPFWYLDASTATLLRHIHIAYGFTRGTKPGHLFRVVYHPIRIYVPHDIAAIGGWINTPSTQSHNGFSATLFSLTIGSFVGEPSSTTLIAYPLGIRSSTRLKQLRASALSGRLRYRGWPCIWSGSLRYFPYIGRYRGWSPIWPRRLSCGHYCRLRCGCRHRTRTPIRPRGLGYREHFWRFPFHSPKEST